MKKSLKSKKNRPRLYIFRSNKHIYAQLVDDNKNVTLASSSSICSELRTRIKSSKTCETAKIIGQDIAKKSQAQGIYDIVFDRGSRIYHGRIKALAEAARNSGLNF